METYLNFTFQPLLPVQLVDPEVIEKHWNNPLRVFEREHTEIRAG